MKKYIGTKQVEAEHMTMGEANNKKLVAIGSSRLSMYEKSSEGYHVKYNDGVETWLPKDEFEKTYQCSETYIDRMLIEESNLNEKIEKLGAFIFNSDKYECLSAQKKNMLKAQCSAMISYRAILVERIRVEQEELKRLMGEPYCGRTCDCDTDCGHKCQEGGSNQAENAG